MVFRDKRFRTGRQFTTNILARGILWRLERTEIRFGETPSSFPIPHSLNAFSVSTRRLWRLGPSMPSTSRPRRIRRLELPCSPQH